jgi:hypothetical protein
VSGCCLTLTQQLFSFIMAMQVNFQGNDDHDDDDDDVCLLLNQHA